jgi:hypothetical protein
MVVGMPARITAIDRMGMAVPVSMPIVTPTPRAVDMDYLVPLRILASGDVRPILPASMPIVMSTAFHMDMDMPGDVNAS